MQFNEEKITFSTKGTGEIGYPQAKRKKNNLYQSGFSRDTELREREKKRERERGGNSVYREKERERDLF